MKVVLATVGLVIALCAPAHATLLWDWSYGGDGISASGTFTTADTPDASGFFDITGISGLRNGVAITGLQPTGTAIPGNEPYAVDNLVRVAGSQLTVNGFGFSLADGTYSNPFYADFDTPPDYLEFYSVPGNPALSTELPISFAASIVATPAPALGTGGAGLLALATGGLALARWRSREQGRLRL